MSDAAYSVLAPELPANDSPVVWGSLYGSAQTLALARAAQRADCPLVILASDEQQAFRLEREIQYFLAKDGAPVIHFQDLETLPYDLFSPHQEIISARLAAMQRMASINKGVIIVTVAAMIKRLPPPEFLDGEAFSLKVGDTLDIEVMRAKLEKAGYSCLSQVAEHGEFAVRGALFDLFPMGAKHPYRIDLFDDEVESIRTFDADTQRSLDKVKHIELLPAREFPFDDKAISTFRTNYRDYFGGNTSESHIYRDVSNAQVPGGIEYYLPLFFDRTASFFDYLPDTCQWVTLDDITHSIEQEQTEIANRFEQRAVDPERPLMRPEDVFLGQEELDRILHQQNMIQVQSFEQQTSGSTDVCNFASALPPALSINVRAPEPLQLLKQFTTVNPHRILITCDSSGRREALVELLKDNQFKVVTIDHWSDFLNSDTPLAITVAPMQEGLMLNDPQLIIATEAQLYGERAKQIRRRKAAKDPASIIRDLTDLSIGSPVVHEDHGIGRYLGLQTIDVGGVEGEFLLLEYAGEDKLYIPVHALDLISRYTGSNVDTVSLHKLGSGAWEKSKRKATEKAFDIAAELLDVQSRRSARKGHAYKIPEAEYQAFCAQFPFEETDDQIVTIESVLADMRAPQPMDRIVCGDVGFGKTEVAMRAVFAAVQAGKQVAILVPTTLLAQQHYNNFADRFADWPIQISQLSRFRSKKQQDVTLAGMESGGTDVVIGTHKLLQDGMNFKDLGLIVIDEEQRFGVRHKESLKKLRAEVDVLTLTATPIPRTLNMAMSGLRDMSIIATPPANRLAVKTFVTEWNDGLIVEACLRELRRGGQVYFLHNKVDTIESTANKLRELLPEAGIQVAHGQMRESELEQVMLDYYHRRFNILVCTTIIETGIDFPNANTIIIERADNFGLSQLHQLRGRVGRSHHKAYCYLLAPPKKTMTKDALKRLEAIESLEDLGAGFALATHDLEIRGAGELLGEGQSGNIHEVGFSLYSDLLERAIKALRSGATPALDQPLNHGAEVDLGVPALIPTDYLPDVHTRLVLYKRIASAPTDADLKDLEVEMIDRFGLMPDPAKRLFSITRFKQRAQVIGIKKISVSGAGARLTFEDKPNIDPMMLIELIQRYPHQYKLDGSQVLRLIKDWADVDDRLKTVAQLLDKLETSNK